MISLCLLSATKGLDVQKSFEVSKEGLDAVQNFIAAWAEENGVSMGVSTKLAICTDEIVSNVIYYSGAASLDVDCSMKGSEIVVKFMDDGKAFDPLKDAKEPDITASVEEREIGGLGIFMVKKMMKSLMYERDGEKNILTISIENV